MIAYDGHGITVRHGDCRDELAAMAAESVQCVITSPPYFGLRKYAGLPDSVWGGDPTCRHEWGQESIVTNLQDPQKHKTGKSYGDYDLTPIPLTSQGRTCRHCSAWLGQLGNEPTVALFLEHLIDVFRAVKRVLRRDGVAWVNLGDSYSTGGMGPPSPKSKLNGGKGVGPTEKVAQLYAETRIPEPGTKPKDLLLVPERFAIAAQADGWYVRSRVVWAKTSAMPESVRDRPTSAHETIWMLTREPRYFYDAEAVRVPHVDPERGMGSVESHNPHIGRDQNGKQVSWVPGVRQYNPNGANLRNVWLDAADGADLSDLWVLGPEPSSLQHFATFPKKLVQRCILAATSDMGQCAECGAPWRRVTAKLKVPAGAGETAGAYFSNDSVVNRSTKNIGSSRQYYRSLGMEGPPPPKTVGWEHSCKCVAPHVIQTVLDPFLGSGTTAVVARSLGRRCVGIEGSAEYVQMSIGRIEATPLHLVEEGPRNEDAMPLQLDLLAVDPTPKALIIPKSKDAALDVPGSPMYGNGNHNSGLALIDAKKRKR